MTDEQERPRQDLKLRTKQFALRIIRLYTLVDSELILAERLTELRKEANELIAIFTTCVKNAKTRRKGK